MKVSLNTVKQYTDVDISVDELMKKINEQLGGVEEVVNLGERYEKAVIVKVVGCKKHENADSLSVCKIDDGGVVKDVERDNDGYVQVVCGAPNVREGILAVWLPPKATVPASWSDKESFVLDTREIRGVKSNGMLAASDELGIGSDHTGIVEIDPDEKVPGGEEIKPGASFAKVYGLDDYQIDIENKMFTHRPDCFGQLGVAREIAGILGKQFDDPEWYWKLPQFAKGKGLELTVLNEAKDKVPRFMAVAMRDIEIKPSPMWLQCELVRMGSKPINNVVDITNYVMLITGQPLHAYDYDKLHGHMLGARMGVSGEKLSLLNGKTYEVTEDDIVIVDGEGPIGMGGVMGGGNSEVSQDTKSIVLECATFDMYAVRKTSMRHGLFTDAVTRFNKGQSPLQNDRVINYAMSLLGSVAGGTQASDVFDIHEHASGDSYDVQSLGGTLKVERSFINERLGLDLDEDTVETLLRNVHFACYIDDGGTATSITAPFWRTDIELPEDIVEEVGRLYGFDKLPRELPLRSTKPAPRNPRREIKARIRQSLARAGANEVLTYSFIHERTIKNAEQDIAQAFQLSNALSPDLQYYRLSVLPSLLDKVHANIKAGHDEFVLFEIGKGHNKKYHADDDEDLPRELEFVDIVYAGKKPRDGAVYYQVRRLMTQLARDLGFTVKFDPITETLDYPVSAPFDQKRSAMIHSRSGEFIGMIGELKQTVIRNFKLPAYTAALTLDLAGLQKAAESAGNRYQPLSRFPSVIQDISLKVAVETLYEDVFWCVYNAASTQAPEGADIVLSPLSIYQADDDIAHKTITLRLKATSRNETLTDEAVAEILKAASEAASKNLLAITV